MYNKHQTKQAKKLISLHHADFSGKKGTMFGKTTHGKRIYYKGICMRSSWEVKFAYFLDCSNIKWKYEPKRFYMNNYTYLPDFYLPEFNCYIEIKGWFPKKSKKRFDTFKRKYPKLNIKLLMYKKLKELGILF